MDIQWTSSRAQGLEGRHPRVAGTEECLDDIMGRILGFRVEESGLRFKS